jgi:hypothetical protein
MKKINFYAIMFIVLLVFISNSLFAITVLDTPVYIASSFELFKLLGLAIMFFLYVLIEKTNILIKLMEVKK